MKILNICYSDFGGAGIAAFRLHQGLIAEGVDSHFLGLKIMNKNFPNTIQFPKRRPRFHERLLEKAGIAIKQETRQKKVLKKLGGKYEMYSYPWSDYKIEDHPLVRDADIINLHWLAGFINVPSFFAEIKKPIVWTLHDMNLFQGGFHYFNDQIQNASLFKKIDTKCYKTKLKYIQPCNNIFIVTPSTWLLNESKNSVISGSFPHSHIPYGLPLDVFKPFNKEFARKVFNLPQNKTIFLFVSQNATINRKGFDLILPTINEFSDHKDVIFVSVGANFHYENNNLINIGSISDPRLMAILYAAADAFLLPSKEDNLPNVMLESLACGTPIISSNVGGMKDVIKDGFNGLYSESLSSKGFCKAIKHFLEIKNNFSKESIRQNVVNNFDLSIQAKRYIALYEKLMYARK